MYLVLYVYIYSSPSVEVQTRIKKYMPSRKQILQYRDINRSIQIQMRKIDRCIQSQMYIYSSPSVEVQTTAHRDKKEKTNIGSVDLTDRCIQTHMYISLERQIGGYRVIYMFIYSSPSVEVQTTAHRDKKEKKTDEHRQRRPHRQMYLELFVYISRKVDRQIQSYIDVYLFFTQRRGRTTGP